MPRPRKCRLVEAAPEVTYFKPQGVPLRELAEVYLPLEGYEALRLADLEGLKQEEAAERMNVSRQTFSRILGEARRTVAEAVIYGLALHIQGGHYVVEGQGEATIRAREEVRRTLRSPSGAGEGVSIINDSTGGVASTKESSMGKIAVSSEGPTLQDQVDGRFGRAAGFVIVDPETMKFDYLDNGSAQGMSQGAGIQAAETVSRSGARTVLTGLVGPKARSSLEAAGIKIFQGVSGTVLEAVRAFQEGRLQPAGFGAANAGQAGRGMGQGPGLGSGRGMGRGLGGGRGRGGGGGGGGRR